MELNKRHLWIGLIVFIVASFFYINIGPSFEGLLNFGDEGYYASKGLWIQQNLEIPKYTNFIAPLETVNTFFLDNPLPILLVGSLFFLGEGAVRLLNPTLAILTGLLVFVMARRFYNREAGLLGMSIFLAIPSVVTYAVLLYADMLVTFLIASAVYIFYRYEETGEKKYIYGASILAGFAALSKVTGFLVPAIFLLIILLYRDSYDEVLKDLGIVALIFFVVTVPWFGIHNFMQTGNPGQVPVVENLANFPGKEYVGERPSTPSGTYSGGKGAIGTSAGFLSFGLLNYLQFSYSLWAFLTIAIGMSYIFLRRDRRDWLLILWSIPLAALIVWQGGGGRAEDLSRFMVPVAVPLAVAGGLGAERVHEHLKEYKGLTAFLLAVLISVVLAFTVGPAVGAAFFVLSVAVYGLSKVVESESAEDYLRSAAPVLLVLVLFFSVFSASAKAGSLAGTKKFGGNPESYAEACDWVKQNTAKDAILLTIWGSNTAYPCQRETVWAQLGNTETIVFAQNQSSVEAVKRHGIDYIFIQKFSISLRPNFPNYPLSFVRFLDKNDSFERVFNNDVAAIYKVT